MAKINLKSLNTSKFRNFLDSFDVVLCDCDGVLWNEKHIFEGVKESLAALARIGKSIKFVSNNTLYTSNNFHKKICTLHEAKMQDIISPTITIIDYLRQNQIKKKLYVVGSSQMKLELANEGFDIVHDLNHPIEENYVGLRNIFNDINDDVGAVIADFDVNVSYSILTKAGLYLQRPDVLFISGATETSFVVEEKAIIGPGYFQNILEDLSGRKSTTFGKPSDYLNTFLQKRFDIKDSGRILYIGDTLEQDMCFANKCGYKKLLVLTGKTTLSELTQFLEPELSPDFYVSGLSDLHTLVTLHKL